MLTSIFLVITFEPSAPNGTGTGSEWHDLRITHPIRSVPTLTVLVFNHIFFLCLFPSSFLPFLTVLLLKKLMQSI